MKQIVNLKSGAFGLCIRWIGAGVCGLCVALIFGCRALDDTSLLLSSERSYFRNLIAQSAFQNSSGSVHVPGVQINGKSYPYDSLLVSVLASVQSRQGGYFISGKRFYLQLLLFPHLIVSVLYLLRLMFVSLTLRSRLWLFCRDLFHPGKVELIAAKPLPLCSI